MFGQFVVLGGGYSPRQGSEDLSETALSVPEATKIGISWGNLTVFFGGLAFQFFFPQTLVLLIILIISCIIVKICIISLGLWFQFWFPPTWK